MLIWSSLVILGSIFSPLLVDGPQPQSVKPPIPFGGTDFKQYYTTSRLLLEGQNPYDHDKAWVIQKALGSRSEVQVPYGPPTSLLPFIPFGWLDFLTAIQVLMVLNIALMSISCFLWGAILFPSRPYMPLLCAVAPVIWLPCLSLIGLGQVTSLTLLGCSLWSFLMQKKHPILAGCSLALTIIKPHLALGTVIYAVVAGIRQKQWRMLLSFIITVLVMCLTMVAIRPTVWHEYFASIDRSNPTQWFNTTLDGWGRFTFGEWFRIIAATIGLALLAWIVFLAWRRESVKDNELVARNEALVIVLWMLAVPYAFSYDYVLLLPAFVFGVAVRLYLAAPNWIIVLMGWLALDLLYVMKKGVWYEYQFFLIAWGALALHLLLVSAGPMKEKPAESPFSQNQ